MEFYMTNQTVSYETVCATVTNAVSTALTSDNKWQSAGNAVRDFFGSETAVNEVKAQFIADAVIPALPAKHQKSLSVELVRKGSKEYNDLDDNGRKLWETLNKAKKDARAVAHTMFSRVVSYAFPAEKKESVPTDTKTKLIELINDAIKKVQKDQAPDYDATALVTQLQVALSIVK
jgi:hypothetical protein